MSSTSVVLEGELLERFRDSANGGAALTVAERDELARVTSIGNGFFGWCSRLTALDLSPLRKVTSVGRGFLVSCSGLTAIDLAALRDVTSIGDDFLLDCCELTAIDLSPLRKITCVGQTFLGGCSGLTEIDLAPLHNVTKVGDFFLYNCSELKNLDLLPLRNVATVGSFFLGECSGLTELASSPLAKKLGWTGNYRHDELAQLLTASNKQRIADLPISWAARKTALLIRNFAPYGHASDAFKIWSVMRCVVRFLSPLRVPDAVLIAEEERMLEVVAARTAAN